MSHAGRHLIRWCLYLLCMLVASVAMAQKAQKNDTRFEHIRTGFALTGVHANERCEACHVNGVFKGTPRDCAACHTAGSHLAQGNVVMPRNHIPTRDHCDSCHSSRSFSGARFSHAGVRAGSCTTCHNGNTATGKPGGHVQTTASCDSCHRATGWHPAAFDHAGVVPGTCATCHNGTRATGKPNTAVHNGAGSCDTCHTSTRSWTGARVDHSTFTAATNCATCHNGSTATGKPATHIPVGATNCASCHRVTGWVPSTWNHTQVTVANQCASCHSGGFPPADGRPANHIPYASLTGVAITNCDTCHKGSYTAWAPARLHASVSISTQCATCHTGSYANAVGKPADATHASATTCENCHKSTSSWAGARVDHSTFTAATNCATCHNGSSATGKPATHIPVGATNCASCHRVTGWVPSTWNHTQVTVTNQCASCHSGGFPPADGRSANHIPYASLTGVAITNCDTCHKGGYTAWAPARLHASVSISTQCATCHTGSYANAVGKPADTTHASATTCENCHKSTSSWSGARVDHSTFTAATNCATCHNGSTATGKPATHIPVGATNCASCHRVTGWLPSTWNHTQVTVANQCASCHSGGFPPADGRSANHIPYASLTGVAITNCDTCHKAGYTAWAPARLHASVSVSTQCATCHTGSYANAVGKPNTTIHASVTTCESCHRSTSSWTSVTFAHSAANAVGTGTCDTCHNGSTATGKPASHIPVTTGPTKCDSCHRSQSSFAASVTMNHSVVTATSCKTCHSGAYLSDGTTGAQAKPSNHIPENTQLLNGAAMDCSACHRSTTSWGSMTMNHNNSQGGGSGWCKGCHLRGTTYLGSMDRMTMTHRTKTPPAIDCSESGCHRPLGSKGATYSVWD